MNHAGPAGAVTLAKILARIPAPQNSRTAQLRNALGSVPIGTQLAVLFTLAGLRLASLIDRG